MNRTALGGGTTLGYCTNVHAGLTLDGAQDALATYACAVREHLGDHDLGIGWWLPASATASALEAAEAIGAWMREHGLRVFTMNGFPYGDFHGDVVKHAVYEPTWAEAARRRYTLDLARILVQLTPEGGEAGISTLPVAWRGALDDSGLEMAARRMASCAEELARMESETGVLLHLDVEPEPGCHVDTAPGAVSWLERVARSASTEDVVRRHVRICHDICHSAVMFESQDEAFDAYERAGFAVGKVQISSAVHASFDPGSDPRRDETLAQLRTFDEARYLHQTVVRSPNGTTRFFGDLPDALEDAGALRGECRVHFHVPVFLEHLGVLATTRSDIAVAVRRALHSGTRQFEVETYAWNVLPGADVAPDLAAGIARELDWVAAECGGEAKS